MLLAVGPSSATPAAPPAGSIVSWGYNSFGFLGNGTDTGPDCSNNCNSTPGLASLPSGTVAASVTSGHFSSLALTTSRSLLAWGDNTDGQLGIGTTTGPDTCGTAQCSTTAVPVQLPAGTIVRGDATGLYFNLAVTNAGQVYAWGYNGYGELGQGNTTNSAAPILVPFPAGTDVVAVAAGHDTSYALSSSGMVYAWGSNEYGQLGIGNSTGPNTCTVSSNTYACSTSPAPVSLPAGASITAIAAGAFHALALTAAGGILAWGNNNDGQLGIGNNTGPNTCGSEACSTSPVTVMLPAGVTFTTIVGGHYSSLGLTTTGAVYTWGDNYDGQLGNGTTNNADTPGLVTLPPVVTIASSGYHVLALTSAGQVYTWGYNGTGDLGQGTTTGPDVCNGQACSTTPIPVALPGGASAKSIAAGNYFSLVVIGTPPGNGYWLGASDGGIFAEGNAPFYSSLGSIVLNQPIVGMAATPGGQGSWLVAADGGIFTEGNAQFHGSLGSLKLNKPIVGMAATPNGTGYWMVASDGGVFAEGNAQYFGSRGGQPINAPIVGMAATADGGGYWLVGADGGIYSYGDATFHGSTGALKLNKPVVGIAATPDGAGYWLVASDGGIFNYGDANFYGSTGSLKLNKPVVGMASSPTGSGYWLVASDGGIFNYGDAGFFGSTGSIALNKPIVAMATP
jgi:alpha-tubulin suppressor-like RCC1 family protein